MRRFQFNLQRVLDYRVTIEEALLAELAAIRAEHERELARLADMVLATEAFRRKTRDWLSTGGPEEIKRAYNYLQHLMRMVSAQEANIRRIEERRNRKTAEVIEASKSRKALERLREYRLAEHRQESERQEQNFLDDIAGVRHRRSSRFRDYAAGGHG